jgi:magnesium-protoporphyrin O-methyltransferase
MEVAREEADRLGLRDRIEFVQGDFVRLAGDIGSADIVTLDRTICCYPDMERLVALSAERARTAYGIVLPRNRFLVRLAIGLSNVWFRLRRNPYRAYLHSNARVDEVAAANGLRQRAERRTLFWRVAVYDRSATA